MTQIPSDHTIKKWVTEERKSAREYRRYGFTELAADEESHARALTELLKQRKGVE